MNDELKPCPFCGNNVARNAWGNLHCLNCNYTYYITYERHDDWWNTRPIEDALRSELAQARARIAQLEAERRWISVEERLPEAGDTCYVMRHCPDGWDYQIASYKKYFFAPWFSEILATELKHVTHWQPLPEPPKE